VRDRHGGDDLVEAFARWAADQRAEAAASDRARERSLRTQAGASATWAGILVDLAEQATPVTVMVAARRHRGRVVGVGADFCVLEPGAGRPALICSQAISALWPEPGPEPGPVARAGNPSAGARYPSLSLSLLAALSMLADEHSPVAIVTSDGQETVGVLIAAGEDVLTVQTNRQAQQIVYLRLSAVASCEMR